MAGSEGAAFDDPNEDELDTRIMRSSAWGILGYGGANALALVTTLVLARLLVPSDFGLVALALVLLAVAQIAQDSGLGAALIVHRGDVRRASAAVLVFSPLVAVGLYLVYFIAAPIAAGFFDEPQLTEVLRVMALVLVLRGLTIMPLALLQRQMRFGPITAMELVGRSSPGDYRYRPGPRGRRALEPRCWATRLRRCQGAACLGVLATTAFAVRGAAPHAPRAHALRAARRRCESHQLRQRQLAGNRHRPCSRSNAAWLLYDRKSPREHASKRDR